MDTAIFLPPLVRRTVGLLLSCLVVGLFTGCASNTAYVIARRDARFDLNPTNKLTLAAPLQATAAQVTLQQTLRTALDESGIQVVPPAEAEFTLTYWLDDSWKPGKKVIYVQPDGWEQTYPFESGTHLMTTDGLIMASGSVPPRTRVVDTPFYVQGIRLKVYPKTGAGAGQFDTVWEGYIEGGRRVTARREPVLLRTLLRYYGQDFIGRAKLVE